MSPESVMNLGRNAMEVLLMVAAPMLLVVLIIGLLVSIFQAATQINEATLSFIPKLLGVFAVLLVAGPWMLTTMVDYMHVVFTSIPQHGQLDNASEKPNAMVSFSSELLQTWIISLLWPLTRILGVIATAPIFSHGSVPVRVKLGLGIGLTIIIMPTLPPLPQFEIFSFQGLLLLVQQMIIGLAIGFSMRLVFAAVDLAGQLIGTTMGLGFASFFDPQTRGQSTAVNQFLVLLTMLIFLGLDGHLMIISAVANSFITLPISLQGGGIDPMKVAMSGATIFSAGLLLALPAVAALLVTNMALGILTRTAPQLNLFGIGFPITLSIGFLVLSLSLPGMLKPIENFIEQGASNMRQIAQPATSAMPARQPR